MPRSARRPPARRRVAAALALLLVLALGGVAGAAPTYTFSTRFTVPGSANQQGLAYADGITYVAFDMGGGNGRIIAFDARGRKIKRTPLLPLGHAAEVSHRAADGKLYVTVYGTAKSPALHVGVVDMRATPARLVRTYDFSYLGNLGMVAIDNTRDRMVLKSGPRKGPHTFTTTDMSGRVLSRFTDVSQGLGQGLEVHGDDLLLYTSAPGHSSNAITVYSLRGRIRCKIRVPVASEGQGLGVDRLTGHLRVGFADHTVRAMAPAYVPWSRVAPADLLVDAGAEGSLEAGPTPPPCRRPGPSPAA